jgi:hypothetical protein
LEFVNRVSASLIAPTQELAMQNVEEAIRERAYYLWMADGCPAGEGEGYWLSAQREILTAAMSGVESGTADAKPKPVAKRKSATKEKPVAAAAKSKRRAA